jgi:hypothetical protein
MYFPPHWWHEVHNIHTDFGLAIGFRPKIDALRSPIEFMLPFITRPGEFAHRMLFFGSMFKSVARTLLGISRVTTLNSDSGVYSRERESCAMAENIRKYR